MNCNDHKQINRYDGQSGGRWMLIVDRTRNGFKSRRALPAASPPWPSALHVPAPPLARHNHYFILHATYFILHATSFLFALCKFSLHSHTRILVSLPNFCLAYFILALHNYFHPFVIVIVQDLLHFSCRPQVYACRSLGVLVACLVLSSCFSTLFSYSLVFLLNDSVHGEMDTHSDPILSLIHLFTPSPRCGIPYHLHAPFPLYTRPSCTHLAVPEHTCSNDHLSQLPFILATCPLKLVDTLCISVFRSVWP